MGVVWSAHDQSLGRNVALKFLSEILLRDRDSMAGLRREANVMLELTHEHIVRLLTMHTETDLAFLVMELLGGPDLGGVVLEREKKGARGLEPAETLWVLGQLARAIDYAHEKGVTHRDIKPSNIMLTAAPDGQLGSGSERAKLADFGIAFVGNSSLVRQTGYRAAGTMPFMAPEVLRGERPTPAADIYSLGATLYSLSAGDAPFAQGDLTWQILNQPPKPLESGDDALDGAIAAALSKEPDDRPHSARELLEFAKGVRLPRSPVSRVSRPAPFVRWLLTGTAASVVLGVGTWFFAPRAPALEPTVAASPKSDGTVTESPGPNPEPPSDRVPPVKPEPEPEPGPRVEVVPLRIELGPLRRWTQSRQLTVKGQRVSGDADELTIRVTRAGVAGTLWQKIVPIREGSFEAPVTLPDEDGDYRLEFVDRASELEDWRAEVQLDRKKPVPEPDSPWIQGKAPFPVASSVVLQYEFREPVAFVAGADIDPSEYGKLGDLTWVVRACDASHGAAHVPHSHPITLTFVDRAGNQTPIKRKLEVYDVDLLEEHLRQSQPPALGEWSAARLNHEGLDRARAWQAWVVEVDQNALLLGRERRLKLLEVLPPIPTEDELSRATEELARSEAAPETTPTVVAKPERPANLAYPYVGDIDKELGRFELWTDEGRELWELPREDRLDKVDRSGLVPVLTVATPVDSTEMVLVTPPETRPFLIDRTEVTCGRYAGFLLSETSPDKRTPGDESILTEEVASLAYGVRGDRARDFARWAGKRLPTTGECVAAACWNGTDFQRFSWGRTLSPDVVEKLWRSPGTVILGSDVEADLVNDSSPCGAVGMGSGLKEWASSENDVLFLFKPTSHIPPPPGKTSIADDLRKLPGRYGRLLEMATGSGGGSGELNGKADPHVLDYEWRSIGFRCVIPLDLVADDEE
jgi:serine/threonine protein kinase